MVEILKRGSATENDRRNGGSEAWGGLAMAAAERLELAKFLHGKNRGGSGLYIGRGRDKVMRFGFGSLRLGYGRGRAANGVGLDSDTGGVLLGWKRKKARGPRGGICGAETAFGRVPLG